MDHHTLALATIDQAALRIARAISS